MTVESSAASMGAHNKIGITDKEKETFDRITYDGVMEMSDINTLRKLEAYMREEGFAHTAAVASKRMKELGHAQWDPSSAKARQECQKDLQQERELLGSWAAQMQSRDQSLSRKDAQPVPGPRPTIRSDAKPPPAPPPATASAAAAGKPAEASNSSSSSSAAEGGKPCSSNRDRGEYYRQWDVVAEAAARKLEEEEQQSESQAARRVAEKPAEAASGAGPDNTRRLSEANQGLTAEEREWQAEREREKGNDAFRGQEYHEAVECYTLSLHLRAGCAKTHANRAAAYIKLKCWQDAEMDATSALQLQPGNLKALVRRAHARLEMKKPQEAMADIVAALEMDGSNKDVLAMLARAEKMGASTKSRRLEVEEVDGEEEDSGHGEGSEPPQTATKVDGSGGSGGSQPATPPSADAEFAAAAANPPSPQQQQGPNRPASEPEDAPPAAASAQDCSRDAAAPAPSSNPPPPPGRSAASAAAAQATCRKAKPAGKPKKAAGTSGSSKFLYQKGNVTIEELNSEEEEEEEEEESSSAAPAGGGGQQPAAAESIAQRVERVKEEGNEHFRAGALDAALASYNACLQMQPGNAVLLNNRAAVWIKKGDAQRALQDCTAVLEQQPSNLKALMRKGKALQALQQLEDAVEAFRLAASVAEQQHPSTLESVLADLEACTAQLEEAEAETAEAGHAAEACQSATDAQDTAAVTEPVAPAAVATAAPEACKSAADANDTAAVAEPVDPAGVATEAAATAAAAGAADAAGDAADAVAAKKVQGDRLFGEREYVRAEQAYSEALAMGCSDADMTARLANNRGFARFHAEDWRGCIADCQLVLQLQPGNVKALARCGRAHARLGEVDAALRHLRQAEEAIRPSASKASREQMLQEIAQLESLSRSRRGNADAALQREAASEQGTEPAAPRVRDVSEDSTNYEAAREECGRPAEDPGADGGAWSVVDIPPSEASSSSSPEAAPALPQGAAAQGACARRRIVVVADSDSDSDSDADAESAGRGGGMGGPPVAVAPERAPPLQQEPAARQQQQQQRRPIPVVDEEEDDSEDDGMLASSGVAPAVDAAAAAAEEAGSASAEPRGSDDGSGFVVVDKADCSAGAGEPPAGGEGGGDADALREEGNALYKGGRVEAAVEKYTQSLAVAAPSDARALCNRAQALLQLRRYADARADCDAALARDAGSMKALYRRALAWRGDGDLQRAKADAEQLLRLDPSNVQAQSLARELSLAIGLPAEAKPEPPSCPPVPAPPVPPPAGPSGRRQVVVESDDDSDEDMPRMPDAGGSGGDARPRKVDNALYEVPITPAAPSCQPAPAAARQEQQQERMDARSSAEEPQRGDCRATAADTAGPVAAPPAAAVPASSASQAASSTRAAAAAAAAAAASIAEAGAAAGRPLPAVPRTSTDFERDMKRLSGDADACTAYLSAIEPKAFRKVFKQNLSVGILSMIAECLELRMAESKPRRSLAVLDALSRLDRFGLIALQLPAATKQQLHTAIGRLEAAGLKVDAVRAAYPH